jgi:hypothetical protein
MYPLFYKVYHSQKLFGATKKAEDKHFCLKNFKKLWLGWEDSNLRMPVPKTGALPLGHIPTIKIYFEIKKNVYNFASNYKDSIPDLLNSSMMLFSIIALVSEFNG